MEQKHALGRRKSAVARVYAVPGKGNIVINGSHKFGLLLRASRRGLTQAALGKAP